MDKTIFFLTRCLELGYEKILDKKPFPERALQSANLGWSGSNEGIRYRMDNQEYFELFDFDAHFIKV